MSELMFPKTGIKKKRKSTGKASCRRKTGMLPVRHGRRSPDTPVPAPTPYLRGANREKSEEYGLTVYLCPDCHLYGERAAHINKETAALLHKIGQQAFEKTYPDKNFREIFGKNYIWH